MRNQAEGNLSRSIAQKKHREELITMKRSEGTRIDRSPLFAYGRYYPEKLGAFPFKKGGSFQMVMIRKRTKEIRVWPLDCAPTILVSGKMRARPRIYFDTDERNSRVSSDILTVRIHRNSKNLHNVF